MFITAALQTKQHYLLNLCQKYYFCEKKCNKWRSELGLFRQVWMDVMSRDISDAVFAIRHIPAYQERVKKHKSDQGLPLQRVVYCIELYCSAWWNGLSQKTKQTNKQTKLGTCGSCINSSTDCWWKKKIKGRSKITVKMQKKSSFKLCMSPPLETRCHRNQNLFSPLKQFIWY